MQYLKSIEPLVIRPFFSFIFFVAHLVWLKSVIKLYRISRLCVCVCVCCCVCNLHIRKQTACVECIYILNIKLIYCAFDSINYFLCRSFVRLGIENIDWIRIESNRIEHLKLFKRFSGEVSIKRTRQRENATSLKFLAWVKTLMNLLSKIQSKMRWLTHTYTHTYLLTHTMFVAPFLGNDIYM